MKILKYVGAIVLLLVSLGETIPIYLISSGLLLGQGDESTYYFLGKLAAHLLIGILVILFSVKLFISANQAHDHGT